MSTTPNTERSFRFSLAELSGALADLDVLLPLTAVLITLNAINVSSACGVIGPAYLLNAVVHRLPIPVQPLKSLSAAVLALGLSASVVTAGAWWMTIVLIGLAVTNTARWISRLFPKPIVRSMHRGLALLLIDSAWRLWQPSSASPTIDRCGHYRQPNRLAGEARLGRPCRDRVWYGCGHYPIGRTRPFIPARLARDCLAVDG